MHVCIACLVCLLSVTSTLASAASIALDCARSIDAVTLIAAANAVCPAGDYGEACDATCTCTQGSCSGNPGTCERCVPSSCNFAVVNLSGSG